MQPNKAEVDLMRRCAMRELNKRKNFYPKWVEKGKMTQQQADFEIEGMRKIVDYFNWLDIHTGPEQQNLFGITTT